MSNEIRIDDLVRPRLSQAQREALAWGESVRVDFSEENILRAAMERTGLSDFGADDFRARLKVLREEWDGDPEITALSRITLHGYLARYASNRLLIHDTLKRHPEILRQKIERPVIVLGLPRSGTTHLVNLLAADDRFHSLPLWESYEPVPLPGEGPLADGTDPRYQRCAAAWARMQATTPFIAAMHPMEPDHIHEELELMGPDFASYNFEWLTMSPRWRDHYYASDQTPHYEYMKNVLKLLQWRRSRAGQSGEPEKRWVLKCPQHLEQLPVLKKVFPDATVVITHRDPVAVIQSSVTMQAYSQRINRRHVATGALIRYWTDRIEHLLRACVRDRHLFAPEHSFDSFFHTFMADEMGTVAQVYATAGLELTPVAQARLDRYVADHPRGKEGKVIYNLKRDFGVAPDELRERFRFYFDRFPVRAEVK
ncbi:sulfotransferase family protein [Denitratisoma sp. DHT3]|uniref:sulfotransferase family protein n=1 Tax=Denitratisoma sp. DHT3 TaxID=1981880 RepID=UPI001198A6F4|nr:sulfotransferase [Denitratisoma sp. DHT3]QDX80812.1 sulfotransferase family protein [Denitratisoma sp. DHT3]